LDAAAGDGPGGGEAEEVPPGRASRADLLSAAGGDDALLTGLEDHGLVVRSGRGDFPADAADVVRAARELAVHGIEPRHLRVLRTTAEREAALVEQVVSPLRRQQRAGASARAEEVGQQIASTLLRLHGSVLRTALEGSQQRPGS
jgi:hypothetical protein